MRLRKKKSSGSGFTLIEVLISMGLVSVLALVIFALNNFMNQGKRTSDNAFAADQFRKDILALLQNPTAWRYTLRNNNTFQCIRTNSPDCNTAGQPYQGPAPGVYTYSTINNTSTLGPCAAGTCYGGFDVYTAANQAYYSPGSSATAGFSQTGAICSTFTSSTGAYGRLVGNGKCPFRLVLWWTPICPTSGATCPNPPVHVKGYTLYAPYSGDANQGSFNPGNYGIDVILPPNWQ